MSSGPTQLSDTAPARLIQSTGNLYWSSNYADADGGSTIFRASKSSQPGDEVALYGETGTNFAELTFAKVDGEFYGYFIANYAGNGVSWSQIKRIPLGSVTLDGQATILANSPPQIGFSDLVTDGSFLYWVNVDGIGSMPVGGGGPVTTLVAGDGPGNLSVLGKTLYYVDGVAILSVPTGGGTPSTVVESPSTSSITALHVLTMPRPDKALAARVETPGLPIDPLEDIVVVWGEFSGAVYGMVLGDGEITTYQEPTAATKVMSVYATDQRVLWSTMTDYPVNQVRMSYGGDTVTLASTTGEQYVPNYEVLADEVAAYWTDFFVEKYTF